MEKLSEIFITAGEIAERLGVTTATVGLWWKKGDFPEPDEKIGKQFLWKRAAVESAIQEKTRLA